MVDNRMHGEGKLALVDGSSYVGQFWQDQRHGYGVCSFPRGGMYEGDFDQNDMHGEGTYTWSDGRTYTGQWSRNARGPVGRMEWSDGRSYEGDFTDGLKHGEGVLRWPDGRSYSGQWMRGRQHGQGVACNAQGRRRTGQWSEGRFVEWLGPIEATRASHHGSVGPEEELARGLAEELAELALQTAEQEDLADDAGPRGGEANKVPGGEKGGFRTTEGASAAGSLPGSVPALEWGSGRQAFRGGA